MNGPERSLCGKYAQLYLENARQRQTKRTEVDNLAKA